VLAIAEIDVFGFIPFHHALHTDACVAVFTVTHVSHICLLLLLLLAQAKLSLQDIERIMRLTARVTCAGADGGTPSDEKKAEAGKMPVKRADSPASGARIVGRRWTGRARLSWTCPHEAFAALENKQLCGKH
jgi:hypothetical protein